MTTKQNEVCGTSRIVGCRFSLYVMSDRFVEVILGALKEVDSAKVWMKTDHISTCVRGRQSHVFDVIKAIYMEAAKTGLHVSLNGTFSIGCPGDTEGDIYMTEDDITLNAGRYKATYLDTACQFALYPLSLTAYMDTIYDGCQPAQENGTFVGGVHYASQLSGSVHDIFDALAQGFERVYQQSSHTVMTVNLSANSPSERQPLVKEGEH